MSISDYCVFDKFVLRTPLFPLSYLGKYLTEENDAINLIKKIWEIEIIREAIYLSSPDLYNEIVKIYARSKSSKIKTEGLYRTLLKYFIRMSSRTTPFGLFAGVCLGEIGNKTDIYLEGPLSGKRHTRLDMNLLCALASDIKKDEKLINVIKFYPNNSLYNFGNCYRYIEYKYVSGKRSHNIISIQKNEYLNKILKYSIKGITKAEILMILEKSGIDISNAKEYIDDLIDSQVLQNDFEPTVSGEEFIKRMISLMESYSFTGGVYDTLIYANNMLKKIDNISLGDQCKQYTKITNIIEETGTKFNKKYLFQTDLIKKYQKCVIDRDIPERILTAIDVLGKIIGSTSSDFLKEFIKIYYERYGDKELPLLEVLDVESGIGYPYFNDAKIADVSSLIDDLHFSKKEEKTNIELDNRAKLLMRKYKECVDNNSKTIEILDSDLEEIDNTDRVYPDSFYAVVYLMDEDKDGVVNIVIESAGGSGAANLNARFSHLDDNIFKFVKEITKKEKKLADDKLLAEIVHLPESRTGNILLRPLLRDYEIPYLANSIHNSEFQIKPCDLRISIKQGRIILRSIILDKEILPRLTTAHNYSISSLPVYRFLCDLQFQNKISGFSFNWYPFDNKFEYYPRVIYKNIILSRAFWKVRTKEISSINNMSDESQRMNKLLFWLRKNNIPSTISYFEGDNELYLRLEEIHYCRIFFDLIKNKEIFYFKESITDNITNCVNSQEGNYVGQFIISYYRNK